MYNFITIIYLYIHLFQKYKIKYTLSTWSLHKNIVGSATGTIAYFPSFFDFLNIIHEENCLAHQLYRQGGDVLAIPPQFMAFLIGIHVFP